MAARDERTLLTAAQRRRLFEVWRSAGWPCRDALEVELIAAGWVRRVFDAEGRETLRVSDEGVQALASTRERHRARLDAHEGLVTRVAQEMQRAGRIVWRGLRLRSPLPGDDERTRWVVAMPDVFSIRLTSVEDFVEPVVHEVKAHRADLLADLRRADKGAAYRALCSQCWYVLRDGIADTDEIPAEYGVMAECDGRLEVRRAAPARACKLPFSVWMALARADAERLPDDDPQGRLG